MEDADLDDVDRRLLHALQVDPRASWAELAPIVGVDAATLARRWHRISAAGIAWTTGYAYHGQLAMLEIECELTRLDAAARALRDHPYVSVLDFSSGSRDLLALVMAPDLATLSTFTVETVGAIPGIRSMRTHLANELLIDGSSWRLRALTTQETARIPPPRPPRARAARRVPADLRAALERELWLDGRASVAAIAERTGFAPQRIADAIATLRASGELMLRTDIAREASGWPIYTWYFVEAPARTVQAARTAITTVPEVRFAFTAASRYNLILAVWLRNLADVNRFEMALEKALEGSRIADRAVVLRIAKHMAHEIDATSHASGLLARE